IYLAGDDPDELPLRVLDLVVQPAQNASRRARVIVLHEVGVDPDVRKRPAVITFEKKPARVAENARLDQKHVGERHWRDFHGTSALSAPEARAASRADTGRRRFWPWCSRVAPDWPRRCTP